MLGSKSVYEHIHPKKFFREHVLQGIRPDGRKLLGYRPVALNVGIVSKADGSATLKIGSSVFICGINAEISKAPPQSSVIVTMSCPTSQPSENDSGSLSEKLILVSSIITQLFRDQNIIDAESLRSPNRKAFWVLYCDILCTNYDGALLDGGLLALTAALKTLKLPKIVFNENSDDFFINPGVLSPIKIDTYPIATTYGIFENSIILVDPSDKEEQLCCLSQVSVITLGDDICAVHKHGSSNVPSNIIVPCMAQSLKRSCLVVKMIETVLSCNK